MATATKIQKDIEELERQAQKLRDQLDYRNGLAENERLATELHEINCLHGFGRDCGFYDAKDFTIGEKKRWLDRADNALKLGNAEQIIRMAEILKDH